MAARTALNTILRDAAKWPLLRMTVPLLRRSSLRPRRLRAVAEPITEQGDHALGAAGAVIVGGRAQACDRAQNIVGIDIATHLAGGHGGLQQRSKRGPDALLEIFAQGLVGRV